MMNRPVFYLAIPVKQKIQPRQTTIDARSIADNAWRTFLFLSFLVFTMIVLAKAQDVSATLGAEAISKPVVSDSSSENIYNTNLTDSTAAVTAVERTHVAMRKNEVMPGNVSLLIEEPIGGAGELLGTGHVSMYFSNLCTDSAASLRPCRQGEEGAVVTFYSGWGDNVPHGWLAMPRTVFFYGVENERDMPLYANIEIRDALREAYRKKHLRDIIPDSKDGLIPPGRWNDMIGAGMDRDIYSLTVDTTPAQGAKFLADFNSVPDQRVFSQVYNNCADFARRSMNQVFEHSTHRDVLNDFSISTPKAIARSFTKYATARPELMFRMEKSSQIDGAIRRSINNRNFTEKVLVSRKYNLLIALTEPPILAFVAGSYFLTGYYSLDGQYRKYAQDEKPVQDLQPAQHDSSTPLTHGSGPSSMGTASESIQASTLEGTKEKKEAVRTRLFGTDKVWKSYRIEFQSIMLRAIETKVFLDRSELRSFYDDLELQSEPAFDSEGRLVLNVNDRGVQRVVGITRANILGPASDRTLAYKIMLSKVNYMINAPGRNRVSLPEFKRDWDLMKQLCEEVNFIALKADANPLGQARFRQANKIISGKEKIQQYLIDIAH